MDLHFTNNLTNRRHVQRLQVSMSPSRGCHKIKKKNRQNKKTIKLNVYLTLKSVVLHNHAFYAMWQRFNSRPSDTKFLTTYITLCSSKTSETFLTQKDEPVHKLLSDCNFLQAVSRLCNKLPLMSLLQIQSILRIKLKTLHIISDQLRTLPSRSPRSLFFEAVYLS